MSEMRAYAKSKSGWAMSEMRAYAKSKSGPFIGPRGGKWADAKHTIAWKPGEAKAAPRKRKSVLERKPKFAVEQTGERQHLLDLLRRRVIDGDTTAEAAQKAGLSVGVTLRLLSKIQASGFEADDGSSLHKQEDEAGKYRGRSPENRQPRRFVWVFM